MVLICNMVFGWFYDFCMCTVVFRGLGKVTDVVLLFLDLSDTFRSTRSAN